ncbi:hypothetical protein ACT4JS_003539, partial [Vibrio cholerae]
GALISFLSNLVVSRRQNQISRVTIKIETLQKKILKLENALGEHAKVSVDISGNDISDAEMIGKGMLLFSQRISVTKSIHYLLPKALVDELVEADSKIGALIYDQKTGKRNDTQQTLTLFKKVQELDSRLPDAISEELRKCQGKLDNEVGS